MSTPSSKPSPTDSPVPSPAPTGGYTDYLLLSSLPSSSSGWKHNIMKFSAIGDKSIDPTSAQFAHPVKLNRKDPRVVRRMTEEERERINKERIKEAVEAARKEEGGDMDVDEKKVKDEDGADVKPEPGTSAAVKPEKEVMDVNLVGAGLSGNVTVASSRPKGKGGMFKKKTKRVYVASEEARRLQREEWAPWVLEDAEGEQRWVGHLEGGAGEVQKAKDQDSKTGTQGWRPAAAPSEAGGGGSSYVAFVFGESGEGFKVVPVNRWYKFSRGPRYITLGGEEAEDEYNRQQKSTEDTRWMMHRRIASAIPKPSSGASTPTSSSSAAVTNSQIRARLLDKSLSTKTSPASRGEGVGKLRAVVGESSRGGGRDRGRGRRGRGDEQEDGEFDYEEDFQDDEEGIATIDDLADEEEAKELEERIRREMRAADREPEAGDDDEEMDELTNQGKEVKKQLRKRDKTGAYDSDDDDDENPYGSEESDFSDDAASATSARSTRDPRSSPRPSSSSSNRLSSSHHSQSRHHSTNPSRAGSRSGSPIPGTSGSAVLARRATSPSGSGHRRSGSTSRGASPGPGGKRKRDGVDDDAAKRRKNATPPPGTPGSSAEDASNPNIISKVMLVALLKTKASFTTQEVLSHFKKLLKAEPKNKGLIGPLLQSVAVMSGGNLALKPGM